MDHEPLRTALWAGLLSCAGLLAGEGAPMAHAQRNTLQEPRVRAPDFAAAGPWLNIDRPLNLLDLRGQVVLLDFWTYCCINCLHVLPDLRYLEEKYRDQPLVVIGVHSGKFTQEKDPQNIRNAILRHRITHPVVVDSDQKLWNAYAVRMWPTFVLIDPEGYVVGTLSGEGHRERLDRAIAELFETYRKKGLLGRPRRFEPDRAGRTPGVAHPPDPAEPNALGTAGAALQLAFPGKVLADPGGLRLFISDTNNNRVLIADLEGRVEHVIGEGQPGLRDGSYAEARFNQPQGLALAADGRMLYVADTENHALRAVHLERESVQTLAGTGRQAGVVSREIVPGRKAELSSPWDLARVDPWLFIAMAGTHQIWAYDLRSRNIRVFAGTGREAALDGPHERAAFAQPSGLAASGARLYVADAEVSSVRVMDAKLRGRTRTLAGAGELFEFGAQDGAGGEARFQHPLGVAVFKHELYVADTFNHLIRRIDLKTGVVGTWAGTGRPERGTSEAIGFNEPGGLSVGTGLSTGADVLYVADTNNHRIVAIDLATRKAQELRLALPDEGHVAGVREWADGR